MKRWILSLVASVSLLAAALTPSMASALTSQNVVVTAQAAYVAVTNTPGTWTINGSSDGGNGYINPSTTYYSNPTGGTAAPSVTVSAGQCEFNITNASSVVPSGLTLTVNWPAFTGGDAMPNSGTGSATTVDFGAYSYYQGMTFSGKVVCAASSSAALKTGWTTSVLGWGVQISTMTDAWTSGAAETGTITITATAT